MWPSGGRWRGQVLCTQYFKEVPCFQLTHARGPSLGFCRADWLPLVTCLVLATSPLFSLASGVSLKLNKDRSAQVCLGKSGPSHNRRDVWTRFWSMNRSSYHEWGVRASQADRTHSLHKAPEAWAIGIGQYQPLTACTSKGDLKWSEKLSGKHFVKAKAYLFVNGGYHSLQDTLLDRWRVFAFWR